MKWTPKTMSEIDKNQMFIICNTDWDPYKIVIGDLDDLQQKTQFLMYNEIQDLLHQGTVVLDNGESIVTYEFRKDDVVQIKGSEYYITGLEIDKVSQFITDVYIELMDTCSWLGYKTREKIEDFEDHLENHTYTIKPKKNIEDSRLELESSPQKVPQSCGKNNPDCEIVDSWMPFSGTKFIMCRIHQKEIK